MGRKWQESNFPRLSQIGSKCVKRLARRKIATGTVWENQQLTRKQNITIGMSLEGEKSSHH